MPESFYDVLGVGRDATQAEIEDAYRERVKETHPDLNDSPDASDAFKRVQDAEAVLADPEERARYDRLGHASYTRHFHDGRPGDDGGWSVGADPTPEEAGYEPGDVRDGSRSYTPGDGGSRTDRGFGFDPSEYDTTSAYDGAGNPGERSYDVGSASSSDSEASGGAGAGSAAASEAAAGEAGASGEAGAAGKAGDAGGASAAGGTAGASEGGRSRAEWRREAERVRDRWSKDAQRAGRGDDSSGGGGYAVHDWDDTDRSVEPTEYPMETSELVVVAVLFVLYPVLAYSMIAPAFSLLVNVVVGICAIVLMGYLLTMPRVGFYVFGAWSVLAPFVVITIPGIRPLSVVALVIVAAAWIPFGYSVLFMRIVD